VGDVLERLYVLSVLFAFVGISRERGGPYREGRLQFRFDGVGGDLVVSEDEALPFGVVGVSLDAQLGVPVSGESGTGKLQDIFPLLGEGALAQGEEGIFQGQAIFGQFLLQVQKLHGRIFPLRRLVVLRQEAILEYPDIRAFEGLAVGILLGIVGLRALDGKDVGRAQVEVGVLGKHS